MKTWGDGDLGTFRLGKAGYTVEIRQQSSRAPGREQIRQEKKRRLAQVRGPVGDQPLRRAAGMGMGSAMVFCGDIGAVGVCVDGGGDGRGVVRCGEVREFVTRRSSCIKRRNIADLPLVLSKRAPGRARMCCWMAGGMQPVHPDARCQNPAGTPANGAAWVGSLGMADCQLHRSVTSSPKHPKCQMPGRQSVTVTRSRGRGSALENPTRRRGF